eukprot:TRINITY_DN636_c0_g2_i2.p1 TRINITY_DN636_c0_g2~~TRINITY_DN636_c0_g2_i2.p1  ORF type:complete len:280 (-),score=111.94 TRINITY_DN636_c0_g2_i2:263-1102(-)
MAASKPTSWLFWDFQPPTSDQPALESDQSSDHVSDSNNNNNNNNGAGNDSGSIDTTTKDVFSPTAFKRITPGASKNPNSPPVSTPSTPTSTTPLTNPLSFLSLPPSPPTSVSSSTPSSTNSTASTPITSTTPNLIQNLATGQNLNASSNSINNNAAVQPFIFVPSPMGGSWIPNPAFNPMMTENANGYPGMQGGMYNMLLGGYPNMAAGANFGVQAGFMPQMGYWGQVQNRFYPGVMNPRMLGPAAGFGYLCPDCKREIRSMEEFMNHQQPLFMLRPRN